ncbi:MAG TPA: tRNA pseudouridine(55) synthase TruB [Cyclobacteriaceae bacterium]|jgi:tRNA pseudouridine55 synthase|nr:tRNA pseudouridine(55) synthase TruB [Cyclobacteriaceae bacterium]
MEPEGRVLLINKPLEWTSFDVVNKLRYRLRTKKIGHAGTLDPLATGLLIICTGKLTKRIDEFQAQEKEYTGTFVLGQSTPSHDLETEVGDAQDISAITENQIRSAAEKFLGSIQQIPPLYSAIKVDGKRAYKLARKGKEVELKAREVFIKEFEITAIEKPVIGFRVVCSKGTYIRSLARDFGGALGTVAYLSALCRTRIGDFKLTDALTIDQVLPLP